METERRGALKAQILVNGKGRKQQKRFSLKQQQNGKIECSRCSEESARVKNGGCFPDDANVCSKFLKKRLIGWKIIDGDVLTSLGELTATAGSVRSRVAPESPSKAKANTLDAMNKEYQFLLKGSKAVNNNCNGMRFAFLFFGGQQDQ